MKQILYFALFLLVSGQLSAQQKTISGTVTDETGFALPGVIVIEKGTSKGVQTDFSGKYSINVKMGATLQYSYVGYVMQERTVGDENTINVSLHPEVSFDEVMVTSVAIKKDGKSRVTLRGMSSISESSTAMGVGKTTIGRKSINEPQSGQLTAGEINDIEKWDAWLKALKSNDNLPLQNKWGFYLEQKVDVLITDNQCVAVPNIKVSLYNGNNQLLMTALTDALGKAVLFKDPKLNYENESYVVQAYQNGKVHGMKIKDHKTVEFQLEPTQSQNNLDVMFTIDATGSMGDEMEYLKSELKNIFDRVNKSIERKRVALTFYRDEGDEYVVRDYDFDTNIDAAKDFLSRQRADGGGDYEEAVQEALRVSMSKSWRTDSKTKLLFLLLDAPPHYTQENVAIIKAQIKLAQEKGIKIIPIVASGANKDVEFLMRFFSVSTNGTYVFLTDDSGIGNPHLKPTADDYKVEKLNDLIVRLIEKYSDVHS
ncbi:MAG TPA: carboxypeptidase-like regulatory domain-containing protein [Aquaticitalea sp.]|nr:carboxypeptidase-like regulatory domain-containing protein [Aquaticitalea sp.]HNU59721.1 carboxypeptidase-like regulatory domain-containing protein [Aquaticitalea sp.]